jgi:hypothetical protein
VSGLETAIQWESSRPNYTERAGFFAVGDCSSTPDPGDGIVLAEMFVREQWSADEYSSGHSRLLASHWPARVLLVLAQP